VSANVPEKGVSEVIFSSRMLGQRLWRCILSSADVKSLDLVAQVSNLLVYDPR
jgi:hypothetical protein